MCVCVCVSVCVCVYVCLCVCHDFSRKGAVGGKKAAPIQLACSLTHVSFLLHFRPCPDLASPETVVPQEWSLVEEDDESEDAQVSWGFLPLLMRPLSAVLSGLSHSLPQPGISWPHKSLWGCEPHEVSGGKQDVFHSRQTWSGGYQVVGVTPSMYTLQPFTHKCFMN